MSNQYTQYSKSTGKLRCSVLSPFQPVEADDIGYLEGSYDTRTQYYSGGEVLDRQPINPVVSATQVQQGTVITISNLPVPCTTSIDFPGAGDVAVSDGVLEIETSGMVGKFSVYIDEVQYLRETLDLEVIL